MSSFQKLFEEYGGDYAGVMTRLMNDEDMFLCLLPMLFDDPSFSNLEQALSSGNLDAAFDAAHSLKGMSGNLGLTPLYDAVCAIVEPLRKKQNCDYTELEHHVREEYQRVTCLYDQLFEEQS